MKRYLCVYTGDPGAKAAWQQLPEGERAHRQTEGVATWKRWVEQNVSRIVEMGGPLGKTKRVTSDGISDVSNNLGAFVIVEAESQEAAAKLFIGHPHFTIFPGDGVEVMEILPIPAG